MSGSAATFSKLNLKDQREILVLDAPASFEHEIESLGGGVHVVRRLEEAHTFESALAFVTRRSELERISKLLAEKAVGDALLWFAYPKGTSKNHACDFNRDQGWDVLRRAGFDSVRQVAIDAEWSALRFRRIEYINR